MNNFKIVPTQSAAHLLPYSMDFDVSFLVPKKNDAWRKLLTSTQCQRL